MFFFHSSHTQNLHFVGHFVANCPNCGQDQPFALSDLVQTDAIYWVPVKDTVLNQICSCEVCGWAESKPRQEVVKTADGWKLGDSMSKLAAATDYELQNPNVEPINDKTIIALISRIASPENICKFSSSIWVWIFGIGGALTVALLGWILWQIGVHVGKDEFQNCALGFVAGGLTGIIARVQIEWSRNDRVRREIELLHFVTKLEITPEDCHRAVERKGINDEAIIGLVDRLLIGSKAKREREMT